MKYVNLDKTFALAGAIVCGTIAVAEVLQNLQTAHLVASPLLTVLWCSAAGSAIARTITERNLPKNESRELPPESKKAINNGMLIGGIYGLTGIAGVALAAGAYVGYKIGEKIDELTNPGRNIPRLLNKAASLTL